MMFGRHEGLLKQERNKDKLARMTQTLTFPDIRGSEANVVRNVHYVVFTNNGVMAEADDT